MDAEEAKKLADECYETVQQNLRRCGSYSGETERKIMAEIFARKLRNHELK